MNKSSFLAAIALLASGAAFGATDHYVLRDGNHVHHLRITQVGGEITVGADVNFEPNASEQDGKPCSAEISGEGKSTGENEITLHKQLDGEAHYCTLKIGLTPTGAKIEQSKECGYFAAGICHFDSDGKELTKVK
jgi:hypothetical protein